MNWITIKAELTDVNVNDDRTFMDLGFRRNDGTIFVVQAPEEGIERATGLLLSACASKRLADERGGTAERNPHWAQLPFAKIGPPAVGTIPKTHTLVLVHGYGGPYQTAYHLEQSEAEKLIQDLQLGLAEVRNPVTRI
jgi:hypothetical protein